MYIVIGFCVGSTAFCMKQIEEGLIHGTIMIFNHYIIEEDPDDPDKYLNPSRPWICYACLTGFWALCSGVMTTYYGPGAAGSGVAEMIGYINGVNYPAFLGINTLITKVIGVVLAVSGRLCVGKEGPLGHIGACWGALCLYIPPGHNLKQF